MRYSSEDVQQILQRAMATSQDEGFSPAQLQEMANEVGIAPETLKVAEREWLAEREASRQQQESTKRRRRAFTAHLIPYLAVNTSLIVLNLVTTPRYFWAFYPISGWGLGLFFHGWAAYQVPVKPSVKPSVKPTEKTFTCCK
jgi:2TM domain